MKQRKIDEKLGRRVRGYDIIIKSPKTLNPAAFTRPGSRNWRKGG